MMNPTQFLACLVAVVLPGPLLAAEDRLDVYLERLGTLQQCWHDAAEFTGQGNWQKAKESFSQYSTNGLSSCWHQAHRTLAQTLSGLPLSEDRMRADYAKWCFEAENPVLAAKMYESCRGPARQSSFERSFHLSQCYVESKEYAKAKEVLLSLKTPQIASDWKLAIETKVKLLDQRIDGQLGTPEFYCAYLLDSSPQWYRKRLGAIVAAWAEIKKAGCPYPQLKMFARLLGEAGDSTGMHLFYQYVARHPQFTSEQVAEALLNLGNDAYQGKNYTEAVTVWNEIADTHTNTSAWGKAVFNLGILHKEQSQFKEAMVIFQRLIGGQVNDREPGSHIMEAYRNYRPRAQWEIGNCLFAMKDYAGALEAYRANKLKYPFQSWCGNEVAELACRYALYEGLCLEHLKRYDEAVASYFQAAFGSGGFYRNPIVHCRLVELYTAAGQVADLKAILDHEEARVMTEARAGAGRNISNSDVMQYSPTRIMRRLLEIREWGAKHDWPRLIALLRIKGTLAGPEAEDARRENYEAVAAARELASAAAETVPLLIKHIDTADAQDTKWVYYALGLCGTPPAIGCLKERAKKEQNGWWKLSVVYALMQAGKPGDQTLTELYPTDPQVENSVHNLRAQAWGRLTDDIGFPIIPKSLKLPSKLPTSQSSPPKRVPVNPVANWLEK